MPFPESAANEEVEAERTRTVAVPRIRVAALIIEEDRILLVKHRKDNREYFLLPGGGIDYGESAAEALRREVKEETGLEVEPRELILVHDSIPPDRRRHVLNVYFRAQVVGGEMQVKPDHRLISAEWRSVTDLETLKLVPDVAEALANAVREGFSRNAQYLGNLWKDL